MSGSYMFRQIPPVNSVSTCPSPCDRNLGMPLRTCDEAGILMIIAADLNGPVRCATTASFCAMMAEGPTMQRCPSLEITQVKCDRVVDVLE